MPAPNDDVWAALLLNRERAFRVARSRCGTPEEVDDCVQEAMTRVASMPDVDLARIGPLLTAVVSNLAIDGHRVRTRRYRLEERLSTRQLVQDPPDDEVCDAFEARWLWTRRHDLPGQDRRVLELRAQGHSLPEVASALGLTYKAAENALGRARIRMRLAWRATVAFLGILTARRGIRVAGAAAAVLPAALIVALGGIPFAAGEARPAKIAPMGTWPQARTVPAAPPARAYVNRNGPDPLLRGVSSGHRSGASAAAGVTILRSPTTTVGRHLGVGPASLEESHRDETVQETIVRCLDRGLTVTPTQIHCND